MATLDVKQVPSADSLPLVCVLRDADAAECRAAGLEPQDALMQSVRLSAQAWEVRMDGMVIGWWGHAPVSVLGNVGIAWCLTAPAADQHKFTMGRLSYSYLHFLLTMYSQVICEVDLNHKTARHWLRWLGFHEIGRSGRFATMRKVR